MAFDYRKLKGRIVEKYGTQASFAKEMNMSERTLSLKLTGIRTWKQTEICQAITLLDLKIEDIKEYFFTLKVQKI